MSYTSEVLADTPNGYWHLGESASPWADSSGNAHNVVTVNSPTASQLSLVASQPSDLAVKCTGTNFLQSAAVASYDLGDVFTLELWVKRNNASDANPLGLINKGANAYYLRINNSTNKLELLKATVAVIVASTTTIADTNAHHVVATKNAGTSCNLYIDGADVTGTVTNATCTNTATNLFIGSDNGTEVGNCTVDEVAIYPTVLSATRVLAHYQAGLKSAGSGGTSDGGGNGRLSRGRIARSFLDGDRVGREKELDQGISAGLVFPDVPKYAPINPRKGR